MEYGLDLQIPIYGSSRGVCHAQIIPNSTNSLQDHGKVWKFPSTLAAVAGGRGILFPCFGVLFRSICNKINEYFYKGLNRSVELTIVVLVLPLLMSSLNWWYLCLVSKLTDVIYVGHVLWFHLSYHPGLCLNSELDWAEIGLTASRLH